MQIFETLLAFALVATLLTACGTGDTQTSADRESNAEVKTAPINEDKTSVDYWVATISANPNWSKKVAEKAATRGKSIEEMQKIVAQHMVDQELIKQGGQ